MLIKEYRICMPLSVDEYRIAQLYMIQKKSREESTGSESGVEILQNDPYEEGPGGKGQYTFKIYHVGSHLPAWFRNILPQSALRVEEEAWNAYPYTKTRYKVPFVEKFMLEVETRYVDDWGDEENVFQLSPDELKMRQVDFLDMVADPIGANDYRVEEDPKKFVSTKTGRGPLTDDWRKLHTEAQRKFGSTSKQRIMCAYKLCRVEFRYWGMQSKIERFIHDVALRKTMLRAHRQAWCWMDEWYGLTMEDIRALERETARALAVRMARALGKDPDEVLRQLDHDTDNETESKENEERESSCDPSVDPPASVNNGREQHLTPSSSDELKNPSPQRSYRKSSLINSPDMKQAEWTLKSLDDLRRDSSDDEESCYDQFFDAEDDFDPETSSFLTCRSHQSTLRRQTPLSDGVETSPVPNEVSLPPSLSVKKSILILVVHGGSLLDTSHEYHNKNVDVCNFRNTLESVLRVHYPSMLGQIIVRLVACPPVVTETLQIIANLSPFAFEMQGHLESVLARDFIPLGAIPLFFSSQSNYDESLETVCSRLNHRYWEFMRSEEGQHFSGSVCVVGDSAGAVVVYDLLCHLRKNDVESNIQPERDDITPTVSSNNLASTQSSPGTENVENIHSAYGRERRFTLDFQVSEFFMLGSPIALVVAFRQQQLHQLWPLTSANSTSIENETDEEVDPASCQNNRNNKISPYYRSAIQISLKKQKPQCGQTFNLFHLTDPCSFRVEPLLCPTFRHIAPVHVGRYSRFVALSDMEESSPGSTITLTNDPLSSGESSPILPTSHYLEDAFKQHSLLSQNGTKGDNSSSTPNFDQVATIWWGDKRVDYGLHCPNALQAFPIKALPHLLHSSYWESHDAAAFIIRQVIGEAWHNSLEIANQVEQHKVVDLSIPFHSFVDHPQSNLISGTSTLSNTSSILSVGNTSSLREKLRRSRNSFKIKNASPNHRANDVIVLDSNAQILRARFMYGPMDVMALTGEMIDIYIRSQPTSGTWEWYGSERTDSHGRVCFQVPQSRRLPPGALYPVRMVVQGGDRSSVEFTLAVLHPNTDAVVFSVDGSFAASVSILGKDPKVRPGGLDVARYWQELGYLLIYVSARPAMQHRHVVRWLAQHNFPHGMCQFSESLNIVPLRTKAIQLQQLVQTAELRIHCAYGSSKDIDIYREYLSLPADRIFIAGVSKRKSTLGRISGPNGTPLATFLTDGYSAHLNQLLNSNNLSRPAQNSVRCMHRRATLQIPVSRSTTNSSGSSSQNESPSPHVVESAATVFSPSASSRLSTNRSARFLNRILSTPPLRKTRTPLTPPLSNSRSSPKKVNRASSVHVASTIEESKEEFHRIKTKSSLRCGQLSVHYREPLSSQQTYDVLETIEDQHLTS